MTTDHEATAKRIVDEWLPQWHHRALLEKLIAAALAERDEQIDRMLEASLACADTQDTEIARLKNELSAYHGCDDQLTIERQTVANLRAKLTEALDWHKDRENFHATFNGGHHDKIPHEAFHHGMDTVFNALDWWTDAIAAEVAKAGKP